MDDESLQPETVDAVSREIAQVTFYLAKGSPDFDSVVNLDVGEAKKETIRIANFEAEDAACRFIYFETVSQRTNPPWLDFLNEKLPDDTPISFKDQTRTPNGILLVSLDGHVLAAVFGRSATSSLVRKELEPDFGIKTAMNMCGNEGIRQTRSQSNTIAPTHIDRQVARPSETFVFGLSEAEDLRYISAHIKCDRNVTRQGRDHPTVKVIGQEKLTWERLISRCRDFLQRYQSKDYVDLFPNYRNFQPASDEEVAQLDAHLVEVLKAKDYSKVDLCIPEFLSEEDYSFSFTAYTRRENRIYAFLVPPLLEEVFKKPDELSIERL